MVDYTGDIKNFVVKTFLFGDRNSLQADTSFMAGGIIDSTGILELVSYLEKTYSIKIQPEEMIPANLDSVDKVAQYLVRKRSGPDA